MLTCEELYAIVKSTEKENSKVELKSFRILYQKNTEKTDTEGAKDLASEIVAFANRFGGKIILGINNDGVFDGKLPIKIEEHRVIDIDSLKQKIFHLIRDYISPHIDCSTEFLECGERDVLVITIPKRKGIPHARVEYKNSSEIKNRIYYIRTSHGKSLLSDTQLEWLFKYQDNPDYKYSFRISFELTNRMLALASTDFIVPTGNYSISYFLENLTEEERMEMFRSVGDSFSRFITELIPVLILKAVFGYYKHSWYIGISSKFGRRGSGKKNTDKVIREKEIRIEDVEITGSKVLNKLNWDLKRLLSEHWDNHPYMVPEDTEVQIIYPEHGYRSTIIFKNPKFRFEIHTGMLSSGSGLNETNPHRRIIMERYPEVSKQLLEQVRFYDGWGEFISTFEFPENDFEDFDMFYHYSNTIKDILSYEWDIQEKLSQFPHNRILEMDSKISDILEELRKNNR